MQGEEKPLDKISMDALTQGETMPDVKQNAIDAVQSKKNEEIAAIVADEQAGIKKNKDGSIAKKRGRKPASQEPFYTGKKSSEKVIDEPAMDSREAATAISGTLEMMSIKLISPEWGLEAQERERNIEAWTRAIDSSGGIALTPWQALMINQAGIIFSRSIQPETKSKFTLAKNWLSMKIAKWKNRNGALSNNRKNTVGKDNVGKEESGQS